MRGQRNKDAAIDLGLEISRSVQIERDDEGNPIGFIWGKGMQWGETRTYYEIGFFCGVSHSAIQFIELGALKKMRKRLLERGVTEEEAKYVLQLICKEKTTCKDCRQGLSTYGFPDYDKTWS